MSSFMGLRVVRGPGWKWGDQDGGEGNAGTVVALSAATEAKPAKVTVVWDCGMKTDYLSNTDGSFELKIVSNMATGVKHPNIPCGADDCWVQEIRGIRWMCASCKMNLCTNCFLKEKPHNKDHNQFERYDTSQTKNPATVWSWGKDGPESRIQLSGIYPGAKVFMGPEWPYGRESGRKRGLVIQDPKEELLGGVLVEWLSSKERSRHPRFENDKLVLNVMENGIGGYYNLNSLPTLTVPIPKSTESCTAPSSDAFRLGDRVQIDSSIQLDKLRIKQKDHGGYKEYMEKIIGRVGTVLQVFDSSDVCIKFRGIDPVRIFRLNPTILKKLNKFSRNQIIRIKNDEETIRAIRELFPDSGGNNAMLEGSIGRISGIDGNDPDKLLVQFDNDQIYRWLDKSYPLPYEWMEPFKTPYPEQDKELAELIEKEQSLFFRVVEKGNLRVAKLLYSRHSVDVDALNSAGTTVLHIACKYGFVDMVEWLIDEAKADIEKAIDSGHRAIHFAANSYHPKVLQVLIEKGAEIDSQSNNGSTALHVAVNNQDTDCVRLLIQRGCNINLQDIKNGDTPLHTAIQFGKIIGIIRTLISSGRINWKLRNTNGFNVLHSAVIKDNHKAIKCILESQKEDLSLEWMRPHLQCNILHYACVHCNYPVVKLLLDHYRVIDQGTDGSIRFQQLLETKYGTEITPLLIAVIAKDYATIELLVTAGADVKSSDPNGNTAIMLAASDSSEAGIPSKENSPAIFQLHNQKDPPLLSLIKYLILKGCCWTATNQSGQKASDILMAKKGYSREVIDSMDQFAVESLNRPSNQLTCIGQQGSCAQQPVFQLICPHKPIYKACSKCILNAFERIKCGCTNESVTSIPGVPVKQEVITVDSDEEGNNGPNGNHEFRWFSDATKNGYVKDKLENKYTWNGTRKSDGGIGFRCTNRIIALDKSSRCPAIVRKFVDNENGSSTFLLETPHSEHYPSANKRERDDGASQGGSSMEGPSAKRERSDAADDGIKQKTNKS